MAENGMHSTHFAYIDSNIRNAEKGTKLHNIIMVIILISFDIRLEA